MKNLNSIIYNTLESYEIFLIRDIYDIIWNYQYQIHGYIVWNCFYKYKYVTQYVNQYDYNIQLKIK